MTVAASLRNIIGECEKAQDYVTREMLEKLLDDTEMDHIYWLEQHLNLIKLMGLPNYIQLQMDNSAPDA
jgi:bacterioferritin